MANPIQNIDDAITSLRERLECATTRAARVLIVEDSPNDTELLLRSIRNGNFDCEVRTCSDSEKAIAEIREWNPDVVLMDQKMPKLSGDEVISQVRGFNTSSEFVIVTGHQDSAVLNRSLKAGAILVLEKPVSVATLKLFLRPRC